MDDPQQLFEVEGKNAQIGLSLKDKRWRGLRVNYIEILSIKTTWNMNAFHLDLRLFRGVNKCRLIHTRKCRCGAHSKGWWLMKKIFRLMCLLVLSSFKKFVLWLFHKVCVKSRFQCYETMSRHFVILTSAITAQVNRCQIKQTFKVFPEKQSKTHFLCLQTFLALL